jgi:hypothetical protein
MLKTQTKEENKFMIRILPHYYQYLTENPHSLLVRILGNHHQRHLLPPRAEHQFQIMFDDVFGAHTGMHRIKMYHLRRKVHFVVMTSVFDTPAQINTIYDLKGSLVGRSATQKERDSGGVLKDNDLLNDSRKIHLGAKKAAFMAQLEKDAMFLAKLNIMDYSLLVGIHDRRMRTRDTLAVPGGRDSSTSSTMPAPLLPSLSAPPALMSAAVTSTASDSGQIVMPIPPAYIHSHSNTPFHRGSALPDFSMHSLPPHGTDITPTALFPGASPAIATRKKRVKSIVGEHEADGTHNIRTGASRSASLGEDPHHRAVPVPGTNLGEEPVNKSLVPGVFKTEENDDVARAQGPADEARARKEATEGAGVEEGTEGEEEEDGDAEYDEEGYGDGEETEESEFEDVDAGDSDEEGDRTTLGTGASSFVSGPPAGGELVVEDGAGALGVEGFKLADLLHSAAIVDKEKATSSTKATATGRTSSPSEASAPVYTYGPGQARRHPWTTRKDEGINSRQPDGKRGDEIYFLGVIDILQQYNAHKRMETIVKVSSCKPCWYLLPPIINLSLLFVDTGGNERQ